LSFLKNLKVRSSVPDKSQPRSTRAATHTPTLADELLRYFQDDDGTIYDTLEPRKIQPSDPEYQTAFKRARALDVVIKVAQRRWDSDHLNPESIMAKTAELLNLAKILYPRPPGPLDGLFDFGPDEKFKGRLPKIVSHPGVV